MTNSLSHIIKKQYANFRAAKERKRMAKAFPLGDDEQRWLNINRRKTKRMATILLLLCANVQAVDVNRLASAIRAEEGANPRWLYGVHHKSQKPLGEAEARNRCIATCQRVWRVWDNAGRKNSYWKALSKVYCPLNAKSWEKNVKSIYEHKKINRS
jgi:hypothetical protein